MTLTPLSAISPIDGRYRKTTEALGAYFSEYALIKYRVLVEVEYFRFLADKKFFSLPATASQALQNALENRAFFLINKAARAFKGRKFVN